MSYSSLYVLDTEFHGLVDKEYKNSWWFSPIVWDVLLDKYLHDEIQTPYGYRKSLIMDHDGTLQRKLNDLINNCNSFSDRICWELSMQQVFFTKDQDVVKQGILDFVTNNAAFGAQRDDEPLLTKDHIAGRFREIAEDIGVVEPELYPHFVFKNTSVDDHVEYWFTDGEGDERSLKDWDKFITEFVQIDNGKITFANNLEFFGKDSPA